MSQSNSKLATTGMVTAVAAGWHFFGGVLLSRLFVFEIENAGQSYRECSLSWQAFLGRKRKSCRSGGVAIRSGAKIADESEQTEKTNRDVTTAANREAFFGFQPMRSSVAY